MYEIKEYAVTVFEDIKHIDELGNEYWLAREIMPLLEYSKW
jgi:DNA-damage-inducible protein D